MANTIDIFGGKVPQRAIRYLDQLPYVHCFHFSNVAAGVDFGAGDSQYQLQTPVGRRAKPIEVSVYDVTETFTDDTTEASVEIGDGSDQDEFAYTDDFSTLAADNADTFTSYDGSLVVGDTEIIEGDDEVTVTCVAPTGGTPAGIAKVSVAFMYFE